MLLPALFWLLVWQAASMAVGSGLLLPGPAETAKALSQLAVTAGFWGSIAASLTRVLLGMVLGSCAGVLLAGLTSAFSWADLLLAPAIRAVRAAPVASFILLILLWTSRTAVPGVIAGLMVMPVVWSAVCRGVARTDPKLLEMARAYRFGRLKTLRLIYLPSVKPFLAGGLNTAMGLAWKSGVAAEVICRPRVAIGARIYDAKLTLETPELFAWTGTVIVLSLCLECLMSRLLRRMGRGTEP